MKYLILSLSVLLVVLACNKPASTVPDRENMLRTGKWKLTDMAYTHLLFKSNIPPYDTTEHDTLIKCDRDDYLVFGPSFNGTINSGSTKCNVGEPDQINFTWQTLNNDTSITLYGMNHFGAADTGASVTYQFSTPGGAPVFPDPYTATFKQFSQSGMVLRVFQTYPDPIDNRKVDTSFWDYTFVNF